MFWIPHTGIPLGFAQTANPDKRQSESYGEADYVR